MANKIGSIALFLAAVFGGPWALADQLVTNGGFETGDFTGWTLAGPVTSSSNPSAFYGVDTLDADSGTYGAYLSTNSTQQNPNQLTLSQALTVQPGHEYVVSFALSQDAAPSLPAFGNLFELTLGNQTLFSQTNLPDSNYTNYSFTIFTPANAAASEPLTFTIQNDLGYFSLDNVSVSSAPEPATLLLAIPVGLVFLLRRKLSA